MSLNPKQRDLFKNQLINLTTDFYPSCRSEKFEVYFVPVKSQKTNEYINFLYVTKLVIKQGDTSKLYSINKVSYVSFIRLDGQVLSLNAEEINKYIINREKNPAIATESSYFIDPDPENPKEKVIQFDDMDIYMPKKQRKDREKDKDKVSSNEKKKQIPFNKGAMVKINGIPKFFLANEFIDLFSKIKVLDKNIFIDKKTKQCLGWGYIYVNPEDVDAVFKVISDLNFNLNINIRCVLNNSK